MTHKETAIYHRQTSSHGKNEVKVSDLYFVKVLSTGCREIIVAAEVKEELSKSSSLVVGFRF